MQGREDEEVDRLAAKSALGVRHPGRTSTQRACTPAPDQRGLTLALLRPPPRVPDEE
jgi:hypothetical protein